LVPSRSSVDKLLLILNVSLYVFNINAGMSMGVLETP